MTIGGLADELNAVLRAAEDALRVLKLGVRAAVELDGDMGTLLVFGKRAGRWGLFVLVGDDERDLYVVSLETRVLAAKRMRDLYTEMLLERDDRALEVANVTDELRAFVEVLRGELGA